MDLTNLMKRVSLLLVELMAVIAVSHSEDKWHYTMTDNDPDIHGGVQMGVSSDTCDNGKDNLTVDWNNAREDYTCMGQKYSSNSLKPVEIRDAECKTLLDPPFHRCMSEPIYYRDPIPTAGSHRPLWAKFGEYKYLPKQRWLHNLEHGCAVFLYHPCADSEEVEMLKLIARSCLRKHIITPLKELSRETPFAVLTYGCKFILPYVDIDRIVQFLRKHALDAPERELVVDGQFDVGLEKPAKVVSDESDSVICPATEEPEIDNIEDLRDIERNLL